VTNEEQVKLLLSLHTESLVNLPTVVGVGVIEAEQSPGTFGIAVYVDRKDPDAPQLGSVPLPDRLMSVVGGRTIEAVVHVIDVGRISF
jgi:hypothetical protein